MTTNENKPRVWVKYKDDIDFSGPIKLFSEEIKVIEFSAIEQKDAEIKELKNNLKETRSARDLVIRQRDMWEKQCHFESEHREKYLTKLTKHKELLAEALKALEKQIEYLDGLVSGREIGTDMTQAGERAKAYSYQIKIEAANELTRIKQEVEGKG